MTRLYGTTSELVMGRPGTLGTSYVGLRIQFKASYSSKKPPLCDVSVNNPNDAMVAMLSDPTIVVRLSVGYEDGPVQLANGRVAKDSLQDGRDEAEPVVGFQINGAAAQLQAASVSQVFSGTVQARTVIEAIRQAMGVAAESIVLGNEASYARGYVLRGAPGPALTTVCRDCDAQWSIVDGRLRVWPRGREARRTADVWSGSTGLVSVAAPGSDGKIKAAAMLRPGLRQGDVVRIESPRWTGNVLVEEVVHQGDTEGDTWLTEIQGRRYA